MKNLLYRFALLALFGFVGVAPVKADFVADFQSPPYRMDETIVGVEGWEARLKGRNPEEDILHAERARLVALRWADGQPALMMKGASLKNTSFPAPTSPRVNVTIRLAVNFSSPLQKSLKPIRIGFAAAPSSGPVEIWFDQGPEGGWVYEGAEGRVVILEKEQVRKNAFYTFSVELDFERTRFNLSLTGEKRDGTPFHYTAREIGFQPECQRKALDFVFLSAGGSRTTAYFSRFAVESQ